MHCHNWFLNIILRYHAHFNAQVKHLVQKKTFFRPFGAENWNIIIGLVKYTYQSGSKNTKADLLQIQYINK